MPCSGLDPSCVFVHSRVHHCPVFIFVKVVFQSVCACACVPACLPTLPPDFLPSCDQIPGRNHRGRKDSLGSQFPRDFSPFWWERRGVGMVLSVKVGNFKGGLFTQQQAEKTDQHQKQRPTPGDRPTAEAPQTSECWHELGRKCSKQNPGNLIQITLLSCSVTFSPLETAAALIRKPLRESPWPVC